MGLRRSPGSSDVFFKVVFGFHFRVAVRQNVLKLRDDTFDLLTVKFGANPYNKTGNTVHRNSLLITSKIKRRVRKKQVIHNK
jgi:hypothetical protein